MPDGLQSPVWGISQRLPPANIQAEQALIGALLANNKAYDLISEFLEPRHFADPIHAKIYKAIVTRLERGALADAVTLKTDFESSGMLDEIGGTNYLVQLLTSMVGIINCGEYGKTIYDTWLRRQLIDIGEQIVNRAFGNGEDGIDGEAMVDRFAEKLSDLPSGGSAKGRSVTAQEAVHKARKEGEAAEKAAKNGGQHASPSTGMPSIDSLIFGLRPGNLIVCGGRPGMGKTALARSITINVGCGIGRAADGEVIDNQRYGLPVAYFGLEESGEDWGAASLAQISAVPMSAIFTGTWTADQASKVLVAESRFESAPIEIFDKPGQSLRDIARAARKIKRKYQKLALVVVDFLQLMADPPNLDKRLSVTANAYGLKGLAKELNCCVLLLSQLSRSVETRSDKRPILADLKETSGIEEAADVVIFPYREWYYLSQAKPKYDGSEPWGAYLARVQDWEDKLAAIENDADVFFPKIRRGRPGYRALRFDPIKTRFEEVEQL